jgi:hypothetical protein
LTRGYENPTFQVALFRRSAKLLRGQNQPKSRGAVIAIVDAGDLAGSNAMRGVVRGVPAATALRAEGCFGSNTCRINCHA